MGPLCVGGHLFLVCIIESPSGMQNDELSPAWIGEIFELGWSIGMIPSYATLFKVERRNRNPHFWLFLFLPALFFLNNSSFTRRRPLGVFLSWSIFMTISGKKLNAFFFVLLGQFLFIYYSLFWRIVLPRFCFIIWNYATKKTDNVGQCLYCFRLCQSLLYDNRKCPVCCCYVIWQ